MEAGRGENAPRPPLSGPPNSTSRAGNVPRKAPTAEETSPPTGQRDPGGRGGRGGRGRGRTGPPDHGRGRGRGGRGGGIANRTVADAVTSTSTTVMQRDAPPRVSDPAVAPAPPVVVDARAGNQQKKGKRRVRVRGNVNMDDVLQSLSSTVEQELRAISAVPLATDASAYAPVRMLATKYWTRIIHLLTELASASTAPGPAWLQEIAALTTLASRSLVLGTIHAGLCERMIQMELCDKIAPELTGESGVQLSMRIIDEMMLPLLLSLKPHPSSSGASLGSRQQSLTRVFTKRRDELMVSLSAATASTPATESDIDEGVARLSLVPRAVPPPPPAAAAMHSDAAQELLLRLGGCGPGVEQEMRERDERNEMVRARFEYTVRRYIPSPEVYIFGSSYTGLTSSTSDVDMLLVVNRAFAASAAEKYAEYQKMLKAEAQLSRLRNSERVVLFLKGFIGSEFFRMSSDGKKVQRSKDSDVIGNDIDGSTMDDEGDVGVEGRDDEADISDDDDLEHKGLDDGSDEEECVVHPSVPPTNGRSAVNNVDDLLTIRSVMFSAIKDFIKKHRAILEASSENVDIVKQARAFIKQQDERERQDKVLYLRKAMGALRNDPNYLIKDFVSQARVPVANFSDANAVPSVDCDVIVNNLLGLYNSRMIREYVFFDASGKIRAFIMLIKKFASKNRINVASEQTLSSYAWVIMALHLLLRLGLLPNFQDDATLSAVPLEERTIVSGIDCTFVVPDPSSKAALSARRAIAATSVSQLLVKFFEYYTRVIDITQSCISLRNKGEVLSKSIWRKSNAWRISIEDPFERADSVLPHDLGTTLNLNGQAMVIRALQGAMSRIDAMKKSQGDPVSEWDLVFEPLIKLTSKQMAKAQLTPVQHEEKARSKKEKKRKKAPARAPQRPI